MISDFTVHKHLNHLNYHHNGMTLYLVNIIELSALFTIFTTISLIFIDAAFLGFPANTQIVGELAFISFHTLTDFVECT